MNTLGRGGNICNVTQVKGKSCQKLHASPWGLDDFLGTEGGGGGGGGEMNKAVVKRLRGSLSKKTFAFCCSSEEEVRGYPREWEWEKISRPPGFHTASPQVPAADITTGGKIIGFGIEEFRVRTRLGESDSRPVRSLGPVYDRFSCS